MRIRWRPRNAQASVLLVAGLIAVPAGVLPGRVALATLAAATATPGARATASATATASAKATASARGPHQAPPVPSPAVPALTISVSDGRTAAKPGDQLTYLVSVRDGGTLSAKHLKITQTLSAGLSFLSASRHGTAANGQVAWYAGIPAGGTQTFRVSARVTRTPDRLLRLAAVACAAADGSSSRPIVCAAHLDRLPAATAASPSRAAGMSGAVPLGFAAAALAVLAAAVLAVIARRRLRLRRQPG